MLVIASRPAQALTFDDAEIAGGLDMRRLMFAAAVIATCAGQARASDVAEAIIDPIAEAMALDGLCDALKPSEAGLVAYLAKNGFIEENAGPEFKKGTPLRDFLDMRAAEYELQFRGLSEEGRCAKGRYFFGPAGTKVPGLLIGN
ncbi:hypothetical protein LB566_03410 [Mesorhizobium sp. CA13]|uniref:hypothetical protein n=1 Tax=Mesorhizobium sp. CA13 TaxID=2876643 RepID=UPI001CCE1DDB|nr:hypothetical protein [Mesorhizobium sp. CA13]MBZ9852830.1 hypothetical protein [Mesorhizobium sp. CA13]